MSLPHLTAADVLATAPMDAVGALRDALTAGLDPSAGPPRVGVDLTHGQVLLMPAEFGDRAGVKIAAVAPGNPAAGLPRIQGVYLLMEATTFTPLATLDGPALTAVRTAAVTVTALEPVLRGRRVAIIGSGPQGVAHARALQAHLHPESLVHLTRRDLPDSGHLRAADVIVCATTAAEPLFDSAILRPGAVVAAIGSHEPDKRELDTALLTRAQVVVEDRDTALREAGDVVLAGLPRDRLIPMADVVTGRVRLAPDRPVVFKGTGMAWQDVVVADLVHRRWSRRVIR
ncbi:ornithine cyclodeaminase family protein [Actinoplanes sp. NPDC051851]|uniref:ornithine cyclodeaminase family protein n=1 Tax=Actinoplanes sp. NPDC051851 TaxID=3154753 RepID=UPI003438FF06